MQVSYFVSHAGQNYGPWTIAEITQKIAQMELIATDYIFDDGQQAWIPILECTAVTAALRAQKPSAPPSSKNLNEATHSDPTPMRNQYLQDASSAGAELYVQRGTHRYGPFTYLGMIKALQEKTIFDYDLVWRRSSDAIGSPEQWIRIAEHEMFTEVAIRDMQKRAGHQDRFFFQRQHPRFPMMSEVIVHDNQTVWLGQTFQASEGGSGMVIQNATIIPGQVLNLHFTGFDGLPSFNALCEVVNKRYVANVRDQRTTVPYGVKFLKIDKRIQQTIREYSGSKKVSMRTAA